MGRSSLNTEVRTLSSISPTQFSKALNDEGGSRGKYFHVLGSLSIKTSDLAHKGKKRKEHFVFTRETFHHLSSQLEQQLTADRSVLRKHRMINKNRIPAGI